MRAPDWDPNLYAVLGTAIEATPDQIRERYLALARELHPDRLSARPAAERAQAEQRLMDVNRAWWVLRDPVRRSDYDRRRSGAGLPSVAPPPPPPMSTERDPVVARPGEGCLLVAGVGAAIVALIGVLVLVIATRNNRGSESTELEFRVDSCVTFASSSPNGDPLVEVDCSNADAVIVDRNPSGACPDGTIQQRIARTLDTLCLEPLG